MELGERIFGNTISINRGEGLLMRGDVVHAGGYKFPENGPFCNIRVHLYVYMEGSIVHDTSLSTNYEDIHGNELFHSHDDFRKADPRYS